MKATILITGEKKEKYLIQTINSCLNQNYYNYEIILLFSYLKNLNLLKKKFNKKIIFKKILKKKRNPVKDQLFKISEGIKISTGKFIFLLDGDDQFKTDKLKVIMRERKRNKLFIDDHFLLKKNKLSYRKSNIIKNNFLYKYAINPWPDKVCTSCISGKKKLFENFYRKVNIYKYQYLAIDIMLVIFYLRNLHKLKKTLTIKKILNVSVDTNYSSIFKKIYWERRIEQHKYLKEAQFINFSVEFYMTKLIYNLFCFHRYIRKIF